MKQIFEVHIENTFGELKPEDVNEAITDYIKEQYNDFEACIVTSDITEGSCDDCSCTFTKEEMDSLEIFGKNVALALRISNLQKQLAAAREGLEDIISLEYHDIVIFAKKIAEQTLERMKKGE